MAAKPVSKSSTPEPPPAHVHRSPKAKGTPPPSNRTQGDGAVEAAGIWEEYKQWVGGNMGCIPDSVTGRQRNWCGRNCGFLYTTTDPNAWTLDALDVCCRTHDMDLVSICEFTCDQIHSDPFRSIQIKSGSCIQNLSRCLCLDTGTIHQCGHQCCMPSPQEACSLCGQASTNCFQARQGRAGRQPPPPGYESESSCCCICMWQECLLSMKVIRPPLPPLPTQQCNKTSWYAFYCTSYTCGPGCSWQTVYQSGDSDAKVNSIW